MNRLMLLSGALALSCTVVMAQAPQRNASVTGAGLKQLNTVPHRTVLAPQKAQAAQAPVLFAAEAPANAVEVPFTHVLGKTGTEVKNYTAINANNDNRKWQYDTPNGYAACMVPNADNIDNNDDWLITVPIHLPAGKYILSFEVGYLGIGATAVQMDVALGTEPTVEAMTQVIVPSTEYTTKDLTLYEYAVEVAEEGYYYLGFHCTTAKTQKGTLKLANVGMKAGELGPKVDPPAAGQLSWVLAPKGELKATVTYVAPTKTISGDDLKEISKVVLTSRWEVDKFEFTDVKPGQTIVQDVEMYAESNNRFTAVAYTGETAGEKVEYKNIWCGPDTPLKPENVKLAVSDDYKHATLTWDAVGEVGENGGYVDPAAVTYYIFDAFGSYYDPALAEVKDGATSYTFDYSDLEHQDFMAYQVTAGYGENYSLDQASNIITVGTPDPMPFVESFANGYYDSYWVMDQNTSYSGQNYGTVDDDYFPSLIDPTDPEAPTPLTSQDGDNGFLYWLPAEKDVMMGMSCVRVDISKATDPVLDFWYQGQGSKLDVLVAGGKDEPAVVKTIDLKEAPTTGWTLCRVPLAEYKSAGAVQFGFRLTAVHNTDDQIWSVPLDHFTIHDNVACDLRLVRLDVPEKVKAGEKVTLSARVGNDGNEDANDAKVQWTVNGEVVETSTLGTIAANGFAKAEFVYNVPLNAPEALEVKASAIHESDKADGNNHSVATAAVRFNEFPVISDLTAEPAEDKVNLKWSVPDLAALPAAVTVTEDFENSEYTAMSITGAGDWTVYDGDGKKTYNIFRELYNPYQTQPMAFQLFDIEAADIPDQNMPDAVSHSGNRYMMAPSAASAVNDNWLISPKLSGNAQTVKFWAKSFTTAWPESFRVCYSTGDNDHTAFTNEVLSVTDADEVWKEYTFNLPEGATYFAINHISEDTYALLVDDVTYEAAPSLPEDLAVTGYHIFRNGKQITDEPAKATEFTDSPLAENAEEGKYTFKYAVAAIYNHGAARVGNEATATVEKSGVDTITVDEAAASAARFYNLQGVLVPAANRTPGIYITVSDKNIKKVLVK
ncbi:MAG: choice-of-anchor J domain-containing protein [Muribaculaceae bacterium]